MDRLASRSSATTSESRSARTPISGATGSPTSSRSSIGFDRHSLRGPWIRRVLNLIRRRPEVRAEELAAELSTDKPWFKRNVRKPKELGLTMSLSPGYRLSPRGESVTKHLAGKGRGK